MACGILVPQPGFEPVSPALRAWSLNHWTIREAPEGWFLYYSGVSLNSKSSNSFLFKFLCIYFLLHWVFTAVHGLALVAAGGLLIAVASVVAEHRLGACRPQKFQLASTRAQAQKL